VLEKKGQESQGYQESQEKIGIRMSGPVVLPVIPEIPEFQPEGSRAGSSSSAHFDVSRK
jgi:hypothetical protein